MRNVAYDTTSVEKRHEFLPSPTALDLGTGSKVHCSGCCMKEEIRSPARRIWEALIVWGDR